MFPRESKTRHKRGFTECTIHSKIRIASNLTGLFQTQSYRPGPGEFHRNLFYNFFRYSVSRQTERHTNSMDRITSRKLSDVTIALHFIVPYTDKDTSVSAVGECLPVQTGRMNGHPRRRSGRRRRMRIVMSDDWLTDCSTAC